MDRLMQGVDEDSGQPFVLFGKVKVQTISDGWKVVDERDGSVKIFTDREQALHAAGVPDEIIAAAPLAPEKPFVKVRGFISTVEAQALEAKAEKLGLSTEAAVRRAIAAWLVE